MKSRSEIYVKAPRNKSVLIGWSAYGLLINVPTLWCVCLIFWKDHVVKFTHTEQILLLLQDCLSHSWWRSKMDGSIWSCKATGTREKWLVVCHIVLHFLCMMLQDCWFHSYLMNLVHLTCLSIISYGYINVHCILLPKNSLTVLCMD